VIRARLWLFKTTAIANLYHNCQALHYCLRVSIQRRFPHFCARGFVFAIITMMLFHFVDADASAARDLSREYWTDCTGSVDQENII